ncbi:type VI secretion system baseplate subunit TssK [Silvimonas soli]|uniref:type VI secretion system baseplate subunit TssK n=1 Tax=Silvimonas soli TaxID=2980100 RepID=UPI0024B3C0FF|nr:type VI secretion system baseplate subunit TssK [Silvimonas soli]
MKIFKPLWSEGALLLPQHFQQQGLFHQAQTAAAAKLATIHNWGIQRIAWDESILDLNKIKLREIDMRLADGTIIDARLGEWLPAARDLTDIPADIQLIVVSVALPLYDVNGSNCVNESRQNARARRFRTEYAQVNDLFGDAVAEMGVERLNLFLVFDFEIHSDLISCPVARLKRDTGGRFRLDADWIPPCLTLSASPCLTGLVERLTDILRARGGQLAARRGERNQNVADYSVSDVSLFWLLNCINTTWPELMHLSTHPDQHPEQLWLALARLAGSLSAFSLENDLDRIPAYRHDQLQLVFGQLEQLIRDLLDTVIPSPVIPIALERVRPTLWRAHLNDERLLADADFFLSIHATIPGHQLQQQLPMVCKLGAPEEVERILNSAVAGVPLTALQRVPSAVPLRLENQYFSLDGRDPAFARMLQTRSCSIYIPASIPEVTVELFAVLRT